MCNNDLALFPGQGKLDLQSLQDVLSGAVGRSERLQVRCLGLEQLRFGRGEALLHAHHEAWLAPLRVELGVAIEREEAVDLVIGLLQLGLGLVKRIGRVFCSASGLRGLRFYLRLDRSLWRLSLQLGRNPPVGVQRAVACRTL